MEGFFSSEKTKATKLGVNGCLTCGLDRLGCIHPYMKPTGKGEKGILIIAEAPGKLEDERGEQLVGEAGRFLRRKLGKLGIDLDRDCRKINAVNCRPPKNRTPEDSEIKACRQRVWDEINSFKPKLIILCGGPALESFLGHRWPEALGGIYRWRGWRIPDQEVKAWVCPIFHPSFVNRQDSKPVYEVIFEQDLKRAIDSLSFPFPKYGDEKECVSILQEKKVLGELLTLLDRTKTGRIWITFDYEATGLKPHLDGHKIICVSICDAYDHSISFMMPEKGTTEFEVLQHILQHDMIDKAGFNIKFEDTWTMVKSGYKVKPWKFDGMLGSHVVDNRTKICSLDFQAYTNFGLLAWDSEVRSFIESADGGGNSFNSLDRAPREDVLLYCGIDSLVEFRLAHKQMALLGMV
jgi:DNA polymerase